MEKRQCQGDRGNSEQDVTSRQRRPMTQHQWTATQSTSNHTILLIHLYHSLDTSGTGKPTKYKHHLAMLSKNYAPHQHI